jgi:DNA-directed RNA polymerase specialized sigma24 family protein
VIALKDVTEPDFAAFVATKQRALLRLAMVLCGDARQAEDIVADVLARAYEKWTRVSGLEQPYAYVRRMVVNEFLSWRRRVGRAFPVARLDDLVDSVPDHASCSSPRIWSAR